MATDTVQGQLDSILKSDSPLMRQAETMGKQRANQRGLLNSSMGVGAAVDSMISSALPVAQQDAAAKQELNQLRASSLSNAWGVMANNMNQQSINTQQAINNIQNNPDISSSNKTSMIDSLIKMRDSDLRFQQSLYDSLNNYLTTSDVFPSLS